MVILSLPHLALEHDARLGLVRATRADVPISGAVALGEVVRAVERRLDSLGRSRLCVLVDLRQAPLRDETVYEAPMAALRVALTRDVRRAAFLVQTGVGLLQVRRYLREQEIHAPVFINEAAALAYLAEAAGRPGD